jgi:hypothetical protein
MPESLHFNYAVKSGFFEHDEELTSPESRAVGSFLKGSVHGPIARVPMLNDTTANKAWTWPDRSSV